MYLEVETGDSVDSSLRLRDHDDFSSFKVVIHGPADEGMVADALAPVGTMGGRDHAWIEPAKLPGLLPAAPSPAWERSLAEMVAYAVSKGWFDHDSAAFRAHCEWDGGQHQ